MRRYVGATRTVNTSSGSLMRKTLCTSPSCRRLAFLSAVTVTVASVLFFVRWPWTEQRASSLRIKEISRDLEKAHAVFRSVFAATTSTTSLPARAVGTTFDMSFSQQSAVLCSDTVPTHDQLRAAAVVNGSVEVKHVACCQTVCRSAPEPLRIPLQHAKTVLASGDRSIDLDRKTESDLLGILVFVTGASADHYVESLLLVRSLQKFLPKNRLLYWDLGLKPEQADEIKSLCGVDYRLFDSSKYPPHVAKLKTYAFKPLVVMESFAESPVLWWADASIRFTMSDLRRVLTQLKERHGIVMFREPNHSVFSTTYPQTYRYLATDENRLKTTVTVMGASFLVANTRQIFSTVLFWFYACALDSRCIAPVSFPEVCVFRGYFEFAQCHRFDQSVLTIIVANVWGFNSDIYRVQQDMFEMLRGEYGGENGDKNVTKCDNVNRLATR